MGDVAIDRIKTAGTGVDELWKYGWSNGWANIVAFELNSQPHVICRRELR